MPTSVAVYSSVIVGAGPAGLAVATELLKRGVPGREILLLDLGPNLEERTASRETGDDRFNTHGFGGAGLFSDGKLCVPDEETTLFPELPTMLGIGDAVPNPHILEAEAKSLYRYAFEEFCRLDVAIRRPSTDAASIETLRDRFSQWGVFFEYYFVYQVEAADLPVAIARQRARLSGAGVTVFTSTKVVDVDGGGTSGISLHCIDEHGPRIVYGRTVVLAVGKIGTSWLEAQANRLGLRREPRPIELGVRVEVPKALLDPFTAVHRDLKLFRRSGDRSLTKTFCTCSGGTVVACRYPELDSAVVLGGYTGITQTSNTNFALMTKIDIPGSMAQDYAFSVIRAANLIGSNRPLVQRLADLKACRATSPDALCRNRLTTTLTDYTLADINLALPRFILDATLETLAQFDQVIPGVNNDDTIISAPCLEYCYRRYELSRHMETSHPGIYVVGDVAGYAKGIIAAASGGILCACDIARRITRGMP
jgi:uncharacterized FAD-dependent dehydrogenase